MRLKWATKAIRFQQQRDLSPQLLCQSHAAPATAFGRPPSHPSSLSRPAPLILATEKFNSETKVSVSTREERLPGSSFKPVHKPKHAYVCGLGWPLSHCKSDVCAHFSRCLITKANTMTRHGAKKQNIYEWEFRSDLKSLTELVVCLVKKS
jgi:hypothetical protein